ncbi:hypothetical protein DSO57_1015122 [Entomophthora muscae]|uniref:Uncharacterized protein n=1 Tax=Entomophthora muscae TaxID=34485 RepID=A0ACC2SUN5_9FUNG|nr:hypothetical protein DSO57_1015122 [Entomophthora muscae]
MRFSIPVVAAVLSSVSSFDYNSEKVRGVNLGGWLVLEPWITPSLFEPFKGKPEGEMAVDEYTFTSILKDSAKEKLEAHWSSFVTETDFQILKDAGINHVRIPVGYWAFNRSSDEPYVEGSFDHLVRGVQLAKQFDINVMIDIHSAPLSQNGFDNSGRAGQIKFLTDDLSGPRMLDVLDKATKYFSSDEYKSTVTSIEVLNEPFGQHLNMDKLTQFYDDAYSTIRNSNSDIVISYSDAFRDLGDWEYLGSKANVLMDTHIYNVFDKSMVFMSPEKHLERTCTFTDKLTRSKSMLPTIVGEWSLASTDCTLYLNGFMKGSRYAENFENHGSPRLNASYDFKNDKCAQYDSVDKFPAGHTDFLRQFFDRQIGVFENAGSGWIFWNFKAENSPEWNFIMGVQKGWIKIPDVTENPC